MKKLAILILLLALPSISNSEPGSTIKYMMDSQISLLDFGCYRLENYITNNDELKNIIVSYNWQDNKIIISSTKVSFNKLHNDAETERQERDIIGKIKYKLLINEDGNSDFFKDAILSKFFSHNGYSTSNEPKNLYDELINTIEIRITINNINKLENRITECKSAITDNRIFCSNVNIVEK